jgi:hypothetical protein
MWAWLAVIAKEVTIDLLAAWLKKRWIEGKKKTKTIIKKIKPK